MDAVFELIRNQQVWIYLLLGIVLVFIVRSIIMRILEYRRAIFGLEREKTLKQLTAAAILFALLLLFLVSTLIISTFTEPVTEIIPTATPAPTLSFLAVQDDIVSTLDPGNGYDTEDVLLVGCNEETSAILSPGDGAVLRGVVEVAGTANLENFAFYKYEYRPVEQGSIWRAIFASTEPVVDGSLGTWDTRLVEPGDYLFRLLVTDTMGNAPYPCVIQVQIEAVEED